MAVEKSEQAVKESEEDVSLFGERMKYFVSEVRAQRCEAIERMLRYCAEDSLTGPPGYCREWEIWEEAVWNEKNHTVTTVLETKFIGVTPHARKRMQVDVCAAWCNERRRFVATEKELRDALGKADEINEPTKTKTPSL